jgi:PAS domain S-box-containing protein
MKKILVIDDCGPTRVAVAAALSRQGYAVLDADNAAAGLDLAISQEPHLVLTDVVLPGRSGLELLRELRQRPETATIPVILMTGQPLQADARVSMDSGADDYLQKPFTMEQLLKTVRVRLDHRARIETTFDAQARAEKTVTAETIRLQAAVLEAAANGIVITNHRGAIVWVNHAFCELTGFTAGEVMGRNPRFLKSGEQDKSFYAEMWATILAGNVWRGELINRRKDGSVYHEDMTITPVRDGGGEVRNFIAIKQDISERKRYEKELAHERDLLQWLMDNLPDYIYFKDLDCHFSRINRALARHLGLSDPQHAIGRSDADFYPLGEARQKLVEERRLLETGEPILGLVEKSDAAQGEKWVSSTKVPLCGADGQVAGLVGISRDITEIKQAQEQLERKSAFLEAQLNTSIDGVLVVDEHAQKVLQNRRFGELLKIPPEICEDRNDAVQLQWVTEHTRDPVQFLERVKYLNSQEHAVARDEIEMQDGSIMDRYSAPLLGKNGNYYGRMWLFRDITERKRAETALRQSEEKFRGLVENLLDAVVTLDPARGTFTSANPAAVKIFGARDEADLLKYGPAELSPQRQPDGSLSRESAALKISGQGPKHFQWTHRRIDGVEFFAEVLLSRMEHGGTTLVLATIRDITERKQLENQLFQARKLESIGQLAAGIAHEINTPTQYVGDNTRFVKDSFAAVARVLESHKALLAAAKTGPVPAEMLARANEILETSDLDYLTEQIPQSLTETLEGIERIGKIVRAMKEFSHPGGREKTPADLNQAIESTVTVARNEWKYVADLNLDLDPALPAVACFIGEINQAVLNLVVNAAHAIGDVVKDTPGAKGVISVGTRAEGEWAVIRVSDTGTGIPEFARPKIFEPFFTTKGVGRGTGQGLAMVYGSVVNRHGGSISFETAMGRGTTFVIRLPIKARPKSSGDGVPGKSDLIA